MLVAMTVPFRIPAVTAVVSRGWNRKDRKDLGAGQRPQARRVVSRKGCLNTYNRNEVASVCEDLDHDERSLLRLEVKAVVVEAHPEMLMRLVHNLIPNE